MSESYLGEIRLMGFGFAPRGWALCNGQHLPINQNQALFSLLGTTYGGDGRVSFALPNLQGRTPRHTNGSDLGWSSGEQNHTLTISEMPAHIHQAWGESSVGDQVTPVGNALARRRSQSYHAPTSPVDMNAASLQSVGGSQPHANMQPFLTLNFCIALQGVYPNRT